MSKQTVFTPVTGLPLILQGKCLTGFKITAVHIQWAELLASQSTSQCPQRLIHMSTYSRVGAGSPFNNWVGSKMSGPGQVTSSSSAISGT